jgi:hypothetical protein
MKVCVTYMLVKYVFNFRCLGGRERFYGGLFSSPGFLFFFFFWFEVVLNLKNICNISKINI